jgi:ATP-binding cassette, subfamily G (WHITE), member 2, SNQ2
MSNSVFLGSNDSVPAIQTTPPGLAANDDTSSANDDPLPSPVIQKHRREGSASRVDIGHFDPVGVDELRRTMSNNRSHVQFEGGGEITRKTSGQSDLTLTDGDGPIDLEKRLRTIVKK